MKCQSGGSNLRRICAMVLILGLVTAMSQGIRATSPSGAPDFDLLIERSDWIFVGFAVAKDDPEQTSTDSVVTRWIITPQITLKGDGGIRPIEIVTTGGSVDGLAIPG